MYSETERRSNYPMSETDMYKLRDIGTVIQKERRSDELDRLQEVREQKAVWLKTVVFCGFLNVVLLLAALYGWLSS